MTEAIIWLVIWGLLALGGVSLLIWIGTFIVGAIAAATEKGWVAAVGIPVVWIGGGVFFVISVINAITEIVTIVQLL